MATITCDNCTESEVWAKIATAVDGDTVVLPDNRPTGGTFTLTYSGQTTAAIAYNASAAAVQSALEALSNIGTGEATVIALGAFAYRITFSGALGFQDVALMTATSSVTPATGRNVVVGEVIKGDDNPPKNEVQAVRIGAAWSSQHILTKAIILQGAGIDNTIILNNFSAAYWIRFDLVPEKVTEITGITFKTGTSTGSGGIDSNSTLRFIGSSTSSYQLRVHDCKFDELLQWPIFTSQVRGVFDHNEFVRCDGGGAYTYGLLWKSEPPTGTPDFGDGSWAYPTNAGGDDAIYFENNLFDQTSSLYDRSFFDGTRGGRAVVRYNTFKKPQTGHNAAMITCHGLETRNRSIRHFEIYNNYSVSPSATNTFINQRGGTMAIFNNRLPSNVTGMGFQHDREADPTFFGRASGSNPVDVNDPNGGSNSAPNPFYSGTMTTGTTPDFIVVAGTPWTADQWIGYSVSDLTLTPWPTGPGRQEVQYVGSVILDNTVNTLTTATSTFGNPHNFASGHTFKIQKCLHAMDQIGRAGTDSGSLVSGGATQGKPPVFPPGWNNQDTEPLYEWNNLAGAANIGFADPSDNPIIRSGVHYINDTVMPGYPWTANVTTICGAEDYENVTLTSSAVNGKGGFTYPHPLVETPAIGPIINVPLDHDFGNVIVGEVGTYDIPVQNTGDALLTVTAVNCSTGYVVSDSDFTVAAGATVLITATFTPVAETTYTGSIDFVSDTEGGEVLGNYSMGVTGVGVAPAGGGGGGKGRKKGVLVQRGR